MRLDKYLSSMKIGTRSEVKEYIKKGRVTLNGIKAKSPDVKIRVEEDIVCFDNKQIEYKEYEYFMLNKPMNVVSATRDNHSTTVSDLIESNIKADLFPIGRLDKDTEGLIILTNDGELTHRLLSPKNHIPKVYYAKVEGKVEDIHIEEFKKGLHIEDYKTLPAELSVITSGDISEVELTIYEGKFHQVKRMFQAVNMKVIYLKRISMGGLVLDDNLPIGEYRELTKEEINRISNNNKEKVMLNGIKAVLFDLDGTLIDSMWLWGDIDDEYLERFGIKRPDDLQNKIEGMSFSDTACYFKERFNIEDSIEKIKEDWNRMAWDKYANEVNMKVGAIEFLKHLKNKNIKMGIATSNSRELVELILKKHNLHGYFDTVRTSCEVKKGKPAPDIYLQAAKDVGVKPEECLVFEDIIQGIMAGLSANMKVCAVYDEYSLEFDAEKRQMANYYISNYEVLL